MSKVRIGFDPDICWDLEIFRDYLEKLKQCDDIELYMLSSELSPRVVKYIKDKVGIPDSRYFHFENFNEKVQAIDDFDLNIFLDGDIADFSRLDNIQLTTYLVYVDYKIDKFYLVQRFIMETDDFVKEVKKVLNIC